MVTGVPSGRKSSGSITEGIDYEAIYVFETATLGKGNFGTFTFTLNGNYLSRYVAAINVGDKQKEYAGQETGFGGYFPHNKLYTGVFYDLGGFDAGVTVHYIGQGSEKFFNNKDEFVSRKIREWTTVDALVSYSFSLPAPPVVNQVPGYNKDGVKSISASTGKDRNVIPVSTADYRQRGWRA